MDGSMEKRKLGPIQLDSYQPLREVVCETLRDAVRRGILQPGERLMEIQLAEDLGVSRTPVREAIRKLEMEGYVIMMPRRGTYVADLSIRDINEVFEIRTSLESLASGLAAERINEDELEKVVGGALTYRWRKTTKGYCGLNGSYTYQFDNKSAFETMLDECMVEKNMTDAETLQAMLAAGIIWPRTN